MPKLGAGVFEDTGFYKSKDFLNHLTSYRKVVTNSYTLVSADEITLKLNMPLLVSPKLDGEQWFLFFEEDWKLVTTTGKLISGQIEILKDAKNAGLDKSSIYGGELHILGSERKRISDLASLIGKGAKADTSQLAFAIWDLVSSPELSAVGNPYDARYEVISKITPTINLFPIETSHTNSSSEVLDIFNQKCNQENLEGLVCRANDGRTFKVKPTKELDCAILGFTEKKLPDGTFAVRSLLFGLQQDDGTWVPICTTGNVGDENLRKTLYSQLVSQKIASNYRLTSKSSGVLYQMVKPALVAELNCIDIQLEDSMGKAIQDPKIELNESWNVVGRTNSASVHNAKVVQIRNDKSAGPDTGWNQLTRIVPVEVIGIETKLNRSQVTRRQVWVKEGSGKVDVRKLVVWKTNKESADYPAFVVHWTDFSSTRKSPLDREVRLAPNEKIANEIADLMIAENVKKGWVERK